jgi:hypothetical protein
MGAKTKAKNILTEESFQITKDIVLPSMTTMILELE